jgi:hypothetical protein
VQCLGHLAEARVEIVVAEHHREVDLEVRRVEREPGGHGETGRAERRPGGDRVDLADREHGDRLGGGALHGLGGVEPEGVPVGEGRFVGRGLDVRLPDGDQAGLVQLGHHGLDRLPRQVLGRVVHQLVQAAGAVEQPGERRDLRAAQGCHAPLGEQVGDIVGDFGSQVPLESN